MDLSKSFDYFDPTKVTSTCHIIGCGAGGSTVAELLARLGIEKINLYDFDVVNPHNIANQMFKHRDIGRLKVDAVKDIICEINPQAEKSIKVFPKGYTPETKLAGFVFLCVDNIDLRREIIERNMQNKAIKVVFDFRTGLEDAQHYAADWSDDKSRKFLLGTMQFTHEEVKQNVPVTACNLEMSVAPTIRIISSYGVANFMNYVNKGTLEPLIVSNAFTFEMQVF